MSRRAVPLAFAFALFSHWFFPWEMVTGECAAAPAPAQPKDGEDVSASAVRLLEHRKVQKELKLSAEQRIAILDGLADIDEEYDKGLGELLRKPNVNDTDYDKLDKRREKQVDKLLTDAATKALTTPQRARLQQLDWRVRGPAAFTDVRVVKKLQLTDSQKKAASEASERVKGELDRYLDGEGDDAKRKGELFEFRKARLKDAMAALTADQKAAWENLIGAAPTGFNVDELWLKIEEDADSAVTPK